MAFKETQQLIGSPILYQMSESVKPYTLNDYGFVQTPSKNYSLKVPLRINFDDPRELMLKVVVKPDLKNFTLAVTTANGLRNVDVYADKKQSDFVTALDFRLDDLIERGVLQHVEK